MKQDAALAERGISHHESIEQDGPWWAVAPSLLWWSGAGVVAFLPFAFDTSAWDAVRLQVPGNQGNWWHLLAGAPFFLAYPILWIRLRALFGRSTLSVVARRALLSVAGLSMAGTLLVESPFMLHLAGTSAWQRFAVLSLGLGVMLFSMVILLRRRRYISRPRACIAALETGYVANAVLCLVVYSEATGALSSRSGWLVTMILIWPISLELAWILFGSITASQAVQARKV